MKLFSRSCNRYNHQKALTILATIQSLFLLLSSTSTITPTLAAEEYEDFDDDSLIPDRLWHELGRGIGNEDLADLAGYAVATSASGYTVAVASPLHTSLTESNPPKRAGRVRVYRYDFGRDGWTKLGQDVEGDEMGDEAGRSLYLNDDGDVLAVGAPYCERRGLKEVGCVDVYELTLMVGPEDEDRDVWFKVGDTLTGETALEHFGMDVHVEEVYDDEDDIDSYQLVTGAPGARVGDEKKPFGKVYLHSFAWEEDRKTLDWKAEGFILPYQYGTDNTEINESYMHSDFGSSISMTGDSRMVLVGAPKYGNYEEGMVALFEKINDTKEWKMVKDFPVDNPENSYEYKCGTSVTIDSSGYYLAYGCPGASSYGGTKFEMGQVHTYYKTVEPSTPANFIWEVKQILYGEFEGDLFGTSIMLSELQDGDIFLAIGAPKNSPSVNGDILDDAGHVRVYYSNFDKDNWNKAGLDVNGLAADARYGSSVAISTTGRTVVGGAPEGGYAKIYQLTRTAPPTPAPTLRTDTGGFGEDLDKDFSQKSASVWFVFFISIFAIAVVFALFLVGKKMHKEGPRGFMNVNTQDRDGGLMNPGTEMVANPGVVASSGEARDII